MALRTTSRAEGFAGAEGMGAHEPGAEGLELVCGEGDVAHGPDAGVGAVDSKPGAQRRFERVAAAAHAPNRFFRHIDIDVAPSDPRQRRIVKNLAVESDGATSLHIIFPTFRAL